jgi:biopolymer transport protein ExbD
LPLRARKWTLRICFALLSLAACVMAVPSRDRFDEYCRNIHGYWLLKTEPNALNRMIRVVYRDWNRESVLPASDDGVVITDARETDLNVELSRKGEISIHDAKMNASTLATIVANRTNRLGAFRVFIWADKNAPPANRDQVVEILRYYGNPQSYFVVTSPNIRKNGIDYKAVPVKPDEN